MKKRHIRAIAIFLLQAFFLTNSVFAYDFSKKGVSCLSPNIKLSLPDFYSVFETAYLNLPDKLAKVTTSSRFDNMTPQQLKSKIIEVIAKQLLDGKASNSLQDIRINIKTTDDAYFNDLLNREWEKQKQKRKPKKERKWVEGLTEEFHEKDPAIHNLRSNKKLKNIFLKRMVETFGKDKAYWEKMPLENLMGKYYQYFAEQKFRQKIIDAENGAQWIDFDVRITLKDEKIETVIRAQRDEDEFKVYLKENIKEEASLEYSTRAEQKVEATQEIEPEQKEELSFLFSYIEDSRLRSLLHGLSDVTNEYNSINDFQTTIRISLGLQEARTICQNGLKANLSYIERMQVERLIKQAILWGRGKRKKQEKQEVSELLTKTIGLDSHLINGELEETIKVIDKAAQLIRSRMNKLLDSIQKRNDKVLRQAKLKNDQILYLEWIKNKIIEAQGYVHLKDMRSAGNSLFSFGKAIEGMGKVSFDRGFGSTYSSINALMYTTDSCLISEEALQLLNEVDYYVQRQANNLRKIQKIIPVGFKQYKGLYDIDYYYTISSLITDLETILESGTDYFGGINKAVKTIEKYEKSMTEYAETSTRINNLKIMILPQVTGVREALELTAKKVLPRNKSIMRAPQPAKRYENIHDARKHLQKIVDLNNANDLINQNMSRIHDKLDTLYVATSILQQDASLQQQEEKEKKQGLEKINAGLKSSVDKIKKRFGQARTSLLLVGQAI